ncbi:hypothetical protein L208DRAFT_1380683 [Tricholoma matsutake]|nr:hypothetical protein L208DRAFT_1380683 [Tricholoma matsutake 945]
MDAENAQQYESCNVQISAIQQVKQGHGCPRGSLNRIYRSTLQKQAALQVNPTSDDTSKEHDGTSDGGHVMEAEGSFAMPGTLEAEKRHPGRPPKVTAGFSISVEVVDGPAAVSLPIPTTDGPLYPKLNGK